MARVILDLSPSLDGYVAGNDITVDAPFGDAGMCLHRWLGFDGGQPEPADQEAAASMFATAGAVVLGRRMFDVGIAHWGPDGAFERPTIVVTRRAQEDLERGATTFHFETRGIEAAIQRARALAGARDVIVAGGAEIARQCLALGLIDELRLHVVPITLGSGANMFDGGSRMEWKIASIHSCTLIHLREVCAKNNSDCIKLNRSWCTACLRESVEHGLVPYDRLIWQVMGTFRCSIHRIRLADSCALCGTRQHWQHSTSIDTCTFCGHALADAPQSSRILPPDPGERHLVELLEYTSGEKAQSFREEAAGVFIHHVSKHADLQDAARRLGRVLRKAEHTRPSLCSLLYISEYFDVSSTLILTNPEKAAYE